MLGRLMQKRWAGILSAVRGHLQQYWITTVYMLYCRLILFTSQSSLQLLVTDAPVVVKVKAVEEVPENSRL
jgi:hypothetical protein